MALSSPQPDGDILGPADILGHLLIICPTEYLQEVATKFDKKDKPSPDAIRVDVAVLTQTDEQGQIPVYRGALWFNVMLAKSLRRSLGETILARMAQGKGTPGQNPPFVLEDAMTDPQAVAFAEQWLANNPQFEAVAQRTYASLNNQAHSSLSSPDQAAATQPRPVSVAIPGGTTTQQVQLPAQASQPAPVQAQIPGAVAQAFPAAVQVPTQPAATAPAGIPAPDGFDPAMWAILTPEQQAAVAQFKG